jgi:hypothetical protein
VEHSPEERFFDQGGHDRYPEGNVSKSLRTTKPRHAGIGKAGSQPGVAEHDDRYAGYEDTCTEAPDDKQPWIYRSHPNRVEPEDEPRGQAHTGPSCTYCDRSP